MNDGRCENSKEASVEKNMLVVDDEAMEKVKKGNDLLQARKAEGQKKWWYEDR